MGAELEARVQTKRFTEIIRKDVDDYLKAQEATSLLGFQALPSERAVAERLRKDTQRRLDALDAEHRFRGEMDLGALLQQTQDVKTPRWFLYRPMLPCDRVRWSGGAKITYEMLSEQCLVGREETPYPNPLSKGGRFEARTLLLPERVRRQVLQLHREGLATYVLYEPREVSKLPEPDPALLVKAGGRWFVADLWDQPDVEDPRALNTLREFFVSPPRRR